MAATCLTITASDSGRNSMLAKVITVLVIMVLSAFHPGFADEVISRHQLKNKQSLTLSLDKGKSYRFKMQGLDAGKVMLDLPRGTISLKEWSKKYQVRGSKEVFAAASPESLPISRADAKRLRSVGERTSIIVASGDGTRGDLECWCKESGYGCWVIP